MTEDELLRLLYVAWSRPLAEYGRETVVQPPDKREGRKSWKKRPLSLESVDAALELAKERLKENPSFIEQQERLGRSFLPNAPRIACGQAVLASWHPSVEHFFYQLCLIVHRYPIDCRAGGWC